MVEPANVWKKRINLQKHVKKKHNLESVDWQPREKKTSQQTDIDQPPVELDTKLQS